MSIDSVILNIVIEKLKNKYKMLIIKNHDSI